MEKDKYYWMKRALDAEQVLIDLDSGVRVSGTEIMCADRDKPYSFKDQRIKQLEDLIEGLKHEKSISRT